MSAFWRVEWHPAVERDVLEIPWRQATEICGAVLRFAATGQGDLVFVSWDPRRPRLRAAACEAVLVFDPARGAICVHRVRRL